MLHIEPDHIEAKPARKFNQPRFGNAVNPRHTNKVTAAQFCEQSTLRHSCPSICSPLHHPSRLPYWDGSGSAGSYWKHSVSHAGRNTVRCPYSGIWFTPPPAHLRFLRSRSEPSSRALAGGTPGFFAIDIQDLLSVP